MSENLKISKLMLLIVLIGIIVRIPFFNYTVDDTYLHFVFAKNIADGKGISFFPGEPSAGTTSPFWIHLLAYTYLLTKDFYFTSKILEYSLSILSIILVYFLTFKLFKSKKLSILSSFFWAINPWHVLWSITGMETSLFTFLTLLGIYWAVENDYKKNLLASIFLGLATLTRPEGAFLFIIMLTSKFFLFLKKKYEMKIILLLALCFFAILAPWLVHSLLTFGSIVPNSFYSIRSFLKFSIQGTFGAGLSGALFVIGSFILQIPFLIIAFSKIVFKRENFHFIPIAWLIALLGFYTLSGLVFVRYFIPVFPLIIIYSLYGLGEVCEKFPIGKFLLIIFLSLFILRDSLLLSFAYSFSEKHQEELMSSYISISNWFKEETPKNSTIAAHDFGALGFFSERRIIDMTGLIDGEALPYQNNLSKFLEIKKPSYVFIVDEWYYNKLLPYIQKCERKFSKICSDCLFPYGNFTFSVYECKTL